MEQVIQLEKVNKWFDDFHVLKDIDLTVTKGQKIVVCGPSGSGKSTMIRCINRLEAHQKGHIVVHGTELTNDLKNIDIIRKNVGMVFQQFNLIPYLSVIDNIRLAPHFAHRPCSIDQIQAMLSALDLEIALKQRASHLSIGQQQRVAIARAMIHQPELLIVDEPTSSLDERNRDRFMNLLLEQVKQQNSALIFVSHDAELARHFSRADNLEQLNCAGGQS